MPCCTFKADVRETPRLRQGPGSRLATAAETRWGQEGRPREASEDHASQIDKKVAIAPTSYKSSSLVFSLLTALGFL